MFLFFVFRLRSPSPRRVGTDQCCMFLSALCSNKGVSFKYFLQRPVMESSVVDMLLSLLSLLSVRSCVVGIMVWVRGVDADGRGPCAREWNLWSVGARGEQRVQLVMKLFFKGEWEVGGMRLYDVVQDFGVLPSDDAQRAKRDVLWPGASFSHVYHRRFCVGVVRERARY